MYKGRYYLSKICLEAHMNYNEWLNEWLIIWVKPMVKDRTFEKYKNTVRLQISPQLGS